MKFIKMHGLGNDYVFVDVRDQSIPDAASLARAVSDRHTGVGSDGLILIDRSTAADVRMVMYNADGSRAAMCGNGIRCVAKYAVERRLVPGPAVRIETDAGIKIAECHALDGRVHAVRVDMGRPSLAVSAIPSTIPADRIVDYPLRLPEPRAAAGAGRPSLCASPSTVPCRVEYAVTCVSMGNPHAVVFVGDVDAIDLSVVGPMVEHAPEFPERINAHFARVDSPTHVTMKTWERGSGITRACGTGACAVGVAGAITQRTHRKITVTLPGGKLQVEWADNDHVYMTGPAVEVFTGDWPM